MKKLIIIPLLFICLLARADIYWVTPRGNDANTGTDSSSTGAWLTWGKAFTSTSVIPGDTVYIREGLYKPSSGSGYSVSRNGSVGNVLCYLAYPGDDSPILDWGSVILTEGSAGISVSTKSYILFRGLTLRNCYQPRSGGTDRKINGWVNVYSTSVTFENCKAYNIEGSGFASYYAYSLIFLNCDAYNCCDTYGVYPGQNGYGFWSYNQLVANGTITYIHCRAWKCSDDGFQANNKGIVTWDGCWSFANGKLTGDGNGIKVSFDYTELDFVSKKVYNCIFVYNKNDGITTNDNYTEGLIALKINVFNNTFYKNKYGIRVFNSSSSDAYELAARVFRNNIVYASITTDVAISTGAYYTHSNNSWDASPAITVTDADFVDLDSTGLSGVRDADGHLPDLVGFLRINNDSDLDSAGIGVGLIYDADSLLYDQNYPSIGAYQYEAVEPPPPPDYPAITTISVTAKSILAITGGSGIDDGMGTVSMKGVCWSTSINPTIADNRTYNGPGTDSFTVTIPSLLPNTTYHLRAYITNETGTTYGADVEFTTLKYSPHINGGKVVFTNGKVDVIK